MNNYDRSQWRVEVQCKPAGNTYVVLVSPLAGSALPASAYLPAGSAEWWQWVVDGLGLATETARFHLERARAALPPT